MASHLKWDGHFVGGPREEPIEPKQGGDAYEERLGGPLALGPDCLGRTPDADHLASKAKDGGEPKDGRKP